MGCFFFGVRGPRTCGRKKAARVAGGFSRMKANAGTQAMALRYLASAASQSTTDQKAAM